MKMGMFQNRAVKKAIKPNYYIYASVFNQLILNTLYVRFFKVDK